MNTATVVVEGKTYTFDPDKFLNVELIAIERNTGMSAMEWQEGLNRVSMLAITGLVWILKRRSENPGLAFDDVVFDPNTLEMNFGDDSSGKAPASASESDLPKPVVTNGTGSSFYPSSVSVPGSQTV